MRGGADAFDFNLSPRAIAHLSALLAAFALVLAAWTWLGRYDLLFAHYSGSSGAPPIPTSMHAFPFTRSRPARASCWRAPCSPTRG